MGQPGNICKAVQQPGNVVKSVAVPRNLVDVENVSVPTEVELYVNTDTEGEKQMPSLAPSSKGGIIVNMVSTQHRDCNLVSKNVSVPTEVKYIKTHKIKGHKIIKKGIFKEKKK